MSLWEHRPRAADLALLLLLASLALWQAASALLHPGQPLEDALMLLRYSRHLAEGHGIRWNIGDRPVEGATDFLYMVAVAGAMRMLHTDAVSAARDLLAACWVLLPPVLYACARFTAGLPRFASFLIAVMVLGGAGDAFIQTGFGGPLMMLAAALATWCGVALCQANTRDRFADGAVFAGLGLGLGLLRPEGNILAWLLLLAVVWFRGLRRSRLLLLGYCAIYMLVGGGYFIWRWHYFGHLLPNPFYVKGGGHLHFTGLMAAAENTGKLLWPIAPFWVLALRNRLRTRWLIATLVPLVGYTAIWVLLSNENNHLMRFQIPLLATGLAFLPMLVKGLPDELGWPLADVPKQIRRLSGVALIGLEICCIYAIYRSVNGGLPVSSGPKFATFLSSFAGKGYSMATTEAGTFPYYSDWRAIDTLGLNDEQIAHEGLSEARLEREMPELLLIHVTPVGLLHGWFHQADRGAVERYLSTMQVMQAFARKQHYVLAAAYGSSPCSLHFFYVRPGTPDTDAIVNYIRNTTYLFLDTGGLSLDFRTGVRQECGFAAGTV